MRGAPRCSRGVFALSDPLGGVPSPLPGAPSPGPGHSRGGPRLPRPPPGSLAEVRTPFPELGVPSRRAAPRLPRARGALAQGAPRLLPVRGALAQGGARCFRGAGGTPGRSLGVGAPPSRQAGGELRDQPTTGARRARRPSPRGDVAGPPAGGRLLAQFPAPLVRRRLTQRHPAPWGACPLPQRHPPRAQREAPSSARAPAPGERRGAVLREGTRPAGWGRMAPWCGARKRGARGWSTVDRTGPTARSCCGPTARTWRSSRTARS